MVLLTLTLHHIETDDGKSRLRTETSRFRPAIAIDRTRLHLLDRFQVTYGASGDSLDRSR